MTSHYDVLVESGIVSKEVARDAEAAKTNIMGYHQAKQDEIVTMRKLRRQLDALPREVVALARFNMLSEEQIKLRDLQEHQMTTCEKLEKILRRQMKSRGENPDQFTIGGHERGVYERFYRVEPMKCMSRSQFMIGLRRVFGDEVCKQERSVAKLHESFDYHRADEMNWRQFLYLMVVLMQPVMSLEQQLRYGYAIFASTGQLDLECRDKITLGDVKDLMTVPVLLPYRMSLTAALDTAFAELVSQDFDASNALNHANGNPDKTLMSFNLLRKMLYQTSFKVNMGAAKIHGIKDTRPWLYNIEALQYHPILVNTLQSVRRHHRNEEVIRLFKTSQEKKVIKLGMSVIKNYVRVRNKARAFLIDASIRWKGFQTGEMFDHWRTYAMEDSAVVIIQRIIRGFLGRVRRDFLYRISRRVIKIQKTVRMYRNAKEYGKRTARIFWAAATIQKYVRGFYGRRRVQYMVEAKVDTERRVLQRRKQDWIHKRRVNAANAIQMCMRRYIKRQKMYKIQEAKERVIAAEQAMSKAAEEVRVEQGVFRLELEKWYEDRKAEYDRNRLNEKSTIEEKRKIISYRRKQKDMERKEIEARKQRLIDKADSEKIEGFIRKWQIIERERIKHRMEVCNRVLQLPETPEERVLQADLKRRIKDHVKVVLNKADKQKIPMEIPEAKEIAEREIIESERKLEAARVKEDMKADGLRIQADEAAAEQKRKDNEKKVKRRARKYSAIVIQAGFRAFVAKRITRERAYKCYKKYFDKTTMNYFYEDVKTHRKTWVKPKIFGYYDIDCDDEWTCMFDSRGDRYYYNPCSWTMTWDFPQRTVPCNKCFVDFCVAKLDLEKDLFGDRPNFEKENTFYCDACMNEKCNSLMAEGIDAEEITYKPLNGAVPNSNLIRPKNLKTETWYNYMLSAKLKASGLM